MIDDNAKSKLFTALMRMVSTSVDKNLTNVYVILVFDY